MRNRQVITLDIGSSFTKIALRSDWNDIVEPLSGLQLASKEESYCIPSTVLRRGRNDGAEWLFGEKAVRTPMDPDRDAIHENWKARLFDGVPGDATDPIAIEVAVRFLAAVRESLLSVGIQVGKSAARVCVPLLSGDGSNEQKLMKAVAKEAGWTLCEDRPVLFEPESNAIGVLSGGVNTTIQPTRQGSYAHYRRMPNLPKMLPALCWVSGRGAQTLLTIDIGAFTTDFGYVRCDGEGSEESWNVPEPTQKSVSLGTFQLEQRVIRSFGEAVQVAWFRQMPANRENLFRQLTNGQRVSLVAERGKSIEIGSDADQRQVKSNLADFAGRILTGLDKFLATKGLGPPRLLTLTGGGSLIPGLREVIEGESAGLALAQIDLRSREAAKKVAKRAEGDTSPRAVERTLSRQAKLIRGGSAVGGCSVYFEALRPS